MSAEPNNLPSESDWLRRLYSLSGVDLPLVGGKAYRLAQMQQHGLNVLPGLVLTTAFFEAQLRYTKLTPLWAGSPDVAVTSEALLWLSDSLKSTPLARPLAQALAAQLADAFGPDITTFAVRSSAVDEDMRDHTFAGVHLTELGVPRVAIPIAISRCWASALGGPAIQYRQDHGMSIQSIKIAVLIQPMLSPERSGVAFSVNPLTGNRAEMVIESVAGLGSSLVAGEVQPHQYRLQNQPPHFPLIEHTPGDSTLPDAARLPDAERRELAGQVRQVEALIGEPQDVEWASQNGQIFLLQTRPIGNLPGATPSLNQTWIRSQASELLPETPSPYWSALLERAQPRVLAFFADTGFDTSDLGAFEKVILGRLFLNLTFLKRLAAQLGLNIAGGALPGSVIDVVAAGSPGVDWRTVWQARDIYRHISGFIRRAEKQFDKTSDVINELTTSLLAASAAEDRPEARLIQLRQQDTLFQTLLLQRFELSLSIVVTAATAGRLTGTPPGEIVAGVAVELPTVAQKMTRKIQPLLQLADASPKLKNYLLNNDCAFEDFGSHPAITAEFRQQFEAVQEVVGDWAIHPPDPAFPRFSEDPAVLLRSLREQLTQRSKLPGKDIARPRPAGQPPAWRRPLTAPVLDKLRGLVSLRLQQDELTAIGMAACRQWGLALGRQWVSAGWLAQPGDIFWLSLADIERTLTAGKSAATTLMATVETNRAGCRAFRGMPLPLTLREDQLATIQFGEPGQVTPADTAVRVGLPVSPGQATGAVMVVTNPAEFTPPTERPILVLPSTGPDWLLLLRHAAGLIVETGGLLSHGSVIAREYGIPAVANIPQATRRYRTGDRLLVDGSTGVVQLLEAGK